MFNEPNSRGSPSAREGARAHPLVRGAPTTGAAGLGLLVCDMEPPAAGNYGGKHGQYMTAGRHKTHLKLARWSTIRGSGISFKESMLCNNFN